MRINRLLKNTRLRRYPPPSSLRRTIKYTSLLGISEALHPGIFQQPVNRSFFNSLFKGTGVKKRDRLPGIMNRSGRTGRGEGNLDDG